MAEKYDLFVIGGGSGGVRAARIAAGHGAKVGLAEEFRMGGTCVIRGCVPKKLLVYASEFSHSFDLARGYGWSFDDPVFDWAKLSAARATEITRLEGAYRRNLEASGATIFDQRATIAGTHEIKLADGTQIQANHILIATGGRPFVPDVPGRELAITSNEVFDLKTMPKRIAIVGGGYIASEFAGIFNGLGVETHQIYRGDMILRGFDEDLRAHVAEAMVASGINLHLKTDVAQISKGQVTLSDGSTLAADQVLYATGRVPNVEGLGLETAGVSQKPNGAIAVDSWSQSNVPSIFAVGDVTDRLQLTPVAIREGHAFADTLFGDKPWRADHETVPTAVFTQPEIGTVGLTETQARETHEIDIYRTSFTPMKDSFAGGGPKMLMKLVVDKATDQVLGAHIAGHGSGELIQAVGIAVKLGATKAQFDATVAVHPTAAEELVTMRQPIS